MKMGEHRAKEEQKQNYTGMSTWYMWEIRCHIYIFTIRNINYLTDVYKLIILKFNIKKTLLREKRSERRKKQEKSGKGYFACI